MYIAVCGAMKQRNSKIIPIFSSKIFLSMFSGAVILDALDIALDFCFVTI